MDDHIFVHVHYTANARESTYGVHTSHLTRAGIGAPNAPINAIADYVVTGRVEDVIPQIITYYQQKQ